MCLRIRIVAASVIASPMLKHIDAIRETVLEGFGHLGKQLRTKLDPDAEGDTRVLK